VGIEADKIVLDIRILEHIVAGKGFERRHPEKLEIEVHRPEQIIHASSVKKLLIRIVKRFQRGIVGD
jgi:hypothetical protein